MKVDVVVVGAGFAGATVAERLASTAGKRVLLVEQRDHVGGNAYDQLDEHGILVQRYGPHIFHTASAEVWKYLCRFTEWNGYTHRVLARLCDKNVFLPINLELMEAVMDRPFTPEAMKEYLDGQKVPVHQVRNARDVIVSQVGEELYELIFRNYTKKQWGRYPEELDPEVTKRIPVRFNRDTRYFTDPYQGIPSRGYTFLFENMLKHENIEVLLGTDHRDIESTVHFDTLVFTGPIDEFFGYRHGRLPYRSLDFRFETLDLERFQEAAVVNYPNDHDYTRITEFKHFYLQRHPRTTICYEYPREEGDPYYPIPMPESRAVMEKYRREAERLKTVHFIGRLGEYRYLNMDQAVASGLRLAEEIARAH